MKEPLSRYILPLHADHQRKLEQVSASELWANTELKFVDTAHFRRRFSHLPASEMSTIRGSFNNESITEDGRIYPGVVFNTLKHHKTGLHVDAEHPSIFVAVFNSEGKFAVGRYDVSNRIIPLIGGTTRTPVLSSLERFIQGRMGNTGRILVTAGNTPYEQKFVNQIVDHFKQKKSIPLNIMLFDTNSPVPTKAPSGPYKLDEIKQMIEEVPKANVDVKLRPNKRIHTLFQEQLGETNTLYIVGDTSTGVIEEDENWLNEQFSFTNPAATFLKNILF